MCGIVAIYHPHGCVSAEALVRGDRAAPPPRPRRPAAMDRAARPGGAGPRPAQHHRPGDRRSADRERGRAAADRRQRRVLRLRADPARAGAARATGFRTRSDSEIALHLYEDLGPQCLHQLRGEYAFVLWDEAQQRIFAARDRFGIKPLFFAWHDGALYLASEVKALFAAGVPGALEPRGAVQCHGPGWPADRDAVRGRVAGAAGPLPARRPERRCRSTATGTSTTRRRPRPADARSDDEWAEEFRAALDEAVRLRLRADVPVGCYLSGGLDSCAVLGLAARHAAEPIRAFTLAFDQAAYDEEAIAREMAALANAEFCPIPIRQADLADHFADATWHAETLCLNAHGVAKYVLSRAVRDAGYKVVLTGEGSDEILAGYPHFRRDMLLYDSEGQDPGGRPLAAGPAGAGQPGVARPAAARRRGGVARRTPARRWDSCRPGWRRPPAGCSRCRACGRTTSGPSSRSTSPTTCCLSSLDVRAAAAGRAPVNQALYLWAKTCCRATS